MGEGLTHLGSLPILPVSMDLLYFFFLNFQKFCMLYTRKLFNFNFKYILLIKMLQLFQFSPLFPSTLHPLHTSIPLTLSSCPCVVHISSLDSPFPILVLTSLCLFCTYHLCFLFPVPFPPFSSLPLPADDAPCDLYFCDSVSVLVAWFVFVLGSVVDSCEFVVILLYIFFTTILFLDKSL